jgi:Protein of unknown function (DUF3309)
MLTAMLAVLALLIAVALPLWPHSREWGYLPAAGIALVVLLLGMHALYMI